MKKTTIKAGSTLADFDYDFDEERFVVPTVWEVKADDNRKMTIHFFAEDGHTEKELRDLGWCGVDDECGGIESMVTARYFKKHTIEGVLSGNNPSVCPKGIRVDDCACVTVDLDVKNNLKIRDELYIDLGLITLNFYVIIWNDKTPVEKYLIECFGGGNCAITKYRDNGKCVAKWPAEEEIKVVLPLN